MAAKDAIATPPSWAGNGFFRRFSTLFTITA
jgi:hypothetical protein